jgi:hypothetical protein
MLSGPTTMINLMLAAILTAGLGIFGPVDVSQLKDWLALISAAVAAVGIYFAVRNVSRQIRINILLREEDRIDKQLPGLRNAVNFLEPFLVYRSVTAFHGTTSEFGRLGFGKPGSTLEKDIEKALPVTDDATRARVLGCLFKAYGLAQVAEGTRQLKEMMENTRGEPTQWEPAELKKRDVEITGATMMFVQQRAEFSNQMEHAVALVADMNREIARYEKRRVRIRAEIERYFGD